MSLTVRAVMDVPEETARVARAAFPKGNPYMKLRDELGPLFCDDDYADLFARQGQAAEPPGLLALATLVQFAEGLSDRQVAEAFRGRIDLKYMAGLELTDPGFDYSVLSEFRNRLLAGQAETRLLDRLLERFKAKGLIKERGRQRSDSTHVLTAVRSLNRLECVGEALRQVLNDLATVAPDWLLAQVSSDWFERYGKRLEAYRLPDKPSERDALLTRIGLDGHHLLMALYAADAPSWLREMPSVETMRRIWVQQYYVEGECVRAWRDEELPPNGILICSPYDPEARNRTKRQLNWTGYAAHLTETCDEDTPNLITHVETTPATTSDVDVTPTIHAALAEKGLLPGEHFVDTAYVASREIIASRNEYGVDLVGPVPGDPHWQAKAGLGFDISCFIVDWEAHTVTCPCGHLSQGWRSQPDAKGQVTHHVHFAKADCLACAERAKCTRNQRQRRSLCLKDRAEHETLQLVRQQQVTDEFKERYKKRAGIEGTISQGVRSFDLRRSRYIGLAKTHLQHVATAAAINLARVADWLTETPRAQTRRSRFMALKPALMPSV